MQYTTLKESTIFLESNIKKLYICEMEKYQLNGTIYYCPVDLTLSVIGGRWQGLIVWNLR